MSVTEWAKRRWLWLAIGVPVLLVVLAAGGTFVYIHFIESDPPPPLTFSSIPSSDGSSVAPLTGGVDGTWSASDASVAGYRVKEVLFGQDNEAAGRTNAVTGDLTIGGTTVNSAKFTVDLTKVTSDSGQRDGQFRGRIMETSKFPTATFELTQPIQLSSIPANLEEISVKATGKLTLHGVTKDVTVDLKARLNGSNLEVNGSIPITFSDYEISNPSGGPASVGGSGEIELLLVFQKS